MEYIKSIHENIIMLLVGGLASLIAIWAIFSNRSIARKKNSLDTILALKGDDNFKEGLRIIHEQHNKKECISFFALPANNKSEEAISIRHVLNFYEYLSVGVSLKLYNEKVLKESMCSNFINVYARCEPFINKVRIDAQPSAFCHFEKLAKKWKNKPVKAPKAK